MNTNQKKFGSTYIDSLAIEADYKSKRISSWDRTGKNTDFISLLGGEKRILAEIKGAGCIKHFYAPTITLDPFFYRNAVLRMYWDGEKNPSVEVPLGDFFGIGHCKPRLFSSLLLSVNPGNPFPGGETYTYGINCYFSMPFSKSALIELENQSDIPLEALWYHINYQEYDELEDNVYRFHARWNREITRAKGDAEKSKNITLWDGVNLDGKDNYTILDAKGNGQLVGIVLNVDNIAGGWWGEGDDMVFIDGEVWPPSIHGTGTEEIFGGGACPGQEYSTPYCGFHQITNNNWYRQNSSYRWFVTDPIRFKKSIKYTLEHGHANNFENDYSSMAYWYQMEPHEKFSILPAKDRMPLLHSDGEKEVIAKQLEVVKKIYDRTDRKFISISPAVLGLLMQVNIAEHEYQKGNYDIALDRWYQIEKSAANL